MTFTQIITYILAMILLAFTLFNLFAMITGKKRKQQSAAQYKAVMGKLELEAIDYMKKNKLAFTEKNSFVCDNDEGILVCRDPKAQVLAIFRKNRKDVFAYEDILDCEAFIQSPQDAPKKISAVYCTITTKQESLRIDLAVKQHRRKSMIGSFVIDMAKEFCDYIMRVETD